MGSSARVWTSVGWEGRGGTGSGSSQAAFGRHRPLPGTCRASLFGSFCSSGGRPGSETFVSLPVQYPPRVLWAPSPAPGLGPLPAVGSTPWAAPTLDSALPLGGLVLRPLLPPVLSPSGRTSACCRARHGGEVPRWSSFLLRPAWRILVPLLFWLTVRL